MQKVKEVGTCEAKIHFFRILEEVQEGTLIRITKHGRVVAELSAPAKQPAPARFGCMQDKDFFMAEDFDAPLEVLQAYM